MTEKKEEREITEKIIRASLIKDEKLRLKELEKIQKDMPSTEQLKIPLSTFKVYSEQLKYFVSSIAKIAKSRHSFAISFTWAISSLLTGLLQPPGTETSGWIALPPRV